MEQHSDYNQEVIQENFIILKFPNREIFNSIISKVDIIFLSNIRNQGEVYKGCENCPDELIEGYWVALVDSGESLPLEMKQYEVQLTEPISFKNT